MIRRALAALLALAVVWGAGLVRADDCQPGRVDLRGRLGVITFYVEYATTSEARMRGLMDRRAMPRDAGMLFVYPRPGPARFWMHDTLIPLDMLFLDEDGRVTRVKARARPLDDTTINGGDKVLAVLEINGGLAAKLGLGPGAVMRSPVLDQSRAAWPCAAR